MALARVAVDYIREHRGGRSDASIRVFLAGQGFSPELLDQAFAEAGPPPPAKRRVWPWVLAALGGAFVLGVAGLALLGAWVGSKNGKKALPFEAANYHPARLAYPANLPAFLPGDLLDEDAAPDYLSMLGTRGGFIDAVPGRPVPAPTEEQAAMMDSALRKERSTFGIRLSRPGTKAFVAGLAVRIQMLMSLSRLQHERFAAAKAREDWAQADVEARRLTLLGWHAAQDWDVAVQVVGLSAMIGGILENSLAAEKLGRRDAAYSLAGQRAALDLGAYAADPAILAAINDDAADPAKLPGLMARLSDPEQRRAYASWTLAMAATHWSAAETASGHPAPAREAFMLEAAAIDDEYIKILAPNFGAMLKEAEREASGAPADKRAEVLDELNKRVAQQGPSNF
ncbi:MAG: hypothetical protein PHS14_05400 [Elusimicrobia bacterium]|nr:hypothetical protein [Elusimicrobiota bacterium]